MDESFDVVLCNHALEHIIDDRKATSELNRVLKPGGWAIITVPQDTFMSETFEDSTVVAPADRLRVFGQEDHVRIHGRDFEARLKDAGFSVETIDYVDQFSAADVRHHGLTAHGRIYRCSK